MSARLALRAADRWLTEHPEVEPLHIAVSKGAAWVASIQVDLVTFHAFAGESTERSDTGRDGVTYTSRRDLVAPAVELWSIEARYPSFAVAFDAVFERLRGPRGLNLVPLADLREALGGVSHGAFDHELYALRVANRYVLHTHDGRHGRPTEAQIDAAIVEDGRTFVYVARRES